jgi:hypothetical protein
MGDVNNNSVLLEVTIAAPAREPYSKARILDDVAWELYNSGIPYETIGYRPQPPGPWKPYAKRTVLVQIKRSTSELQNDVYLRQKVTSFREKLDAYLGEPVFVSYKLVLPTTEATEQQPNIT